MPNENDPGSTPPDEQNDLDQKIAATVNAAVTSHLKRTLDKAIAAALEPTLKTINEKLTAPPPPPPDEEGGKKGKKAEDPETAALRKEIEALKDRARLSDEKAAAVEKKAREDSAYAALLQALDGKVKPEFREFVAKSLFHADKRVHFDEQGNPLFKSSKVPYAGAEPEDVDLPLKAGVEDWIKSESAKPFLPAPSPGAGADKLPKKSAFQPGPTNKKPVTDQEKTAAAMEAARRAAQRLGI